MSYATRILLVAAASLPILSLQPARAEERPAANVIDNAIKAKLGEAGLLQTDIRHAYATFYRHLHLDVAGTSASADEIRKFLDANPHDRAQMIEQLVASADHGWTNNDKARIKDSLVEDLLGLDR